MRNYLNSVTFKRSWRISLVSIILFTIFWLIVKKMTGSVPSYDGIGFAIVFFNKPIIETNFAISQWFTLPVLPIYIFLMCLFYSKNDGSIPGTFFFLFSVIGFLDTLFFGILTGFASTLIMIVATGVVAIVVVITTLFGPIFIDWLFVKDNRVDEEIVQSEEKFSFTPGKTPTHQYGVLKNNSISRGYH